MGDTPILVNGNVNYNQITFVDYSNNRVGISSSLPQYELDINGACFAERYLIGSSALTYQLIDYNLSGYGYWTTITGSGVIYINNNSYAGIGVTNPSTKLQVNGTTSSSQIFINGASTNNIFQKSGSSFSPILASVVDSNVIYNPATGNPFPSALDLSNNNVTDGNSVFISFSSYNSSNFRVAGAQIGSIFEYHYGSLDYPQTSIFFRTTPGSGGVPPTERMRIDPNGNLGIGTTIPEAQLDVRGGIRAAGYGPGSGGFSFGSPGDMDGGMFSTTDGLLQFYTDNTEKMRIINTGWVGIGTTIPQAKLHLQSFGNGSKDFAVQFNNLTGTAMSINYHSNLGITEQYFYDNIGSNITTQRWINDGTVHYYQIYGQDYFQVGSANDDSTLVFKGEMVAPILPSRPGFYHRTGVGLGGFSDTDISFQVNGSSSLVDALYIKYTGLIGVNTTAPTGKLMILTNSNYNTGPDQFHAFKITSGTNNRTLYMGFDNTINAAYINSGEGTGTSTNLLIQPRGGWVGIGTTAPLTNLHVQGGIISTDIPSLYHIITNSIGKFINGQIYDYQVSNNGSNNMQFNLDTTHTKYEALIQINQYASSGYNVYFRFNNDTTDSSYSCIQSYPGVYPAINLYRTTGTFLIQMGADGLPNEISHQFNLSISKLYDSTTNKTCFTCLYTATMNYNGGCQNWRGTVSTLKSGDITLSHINLTIDTTTFTNVSVQIWKI